MTATNWLLGARRSEAYDLARTILGVGLVGHDPERVPPVPRDAIDGSEAWAERLAWLVLQEPDVLEARAAALVEYGNALPDGVTTEAFAEAENLRHEAAKLRG